MNTTAKQVLESAAHVVLVAHTQRAFARGDRGQKINVWERAACQWCTAGAVEAAILDLTLLDIMRRRKLAEQAMDAVQQTIDERHGGGNYSVVGWNDEVCATGEDAYYLLMEAASK